MKNIIYRRAHDYEYEKIIAMQSNIFYIEQGIPEDDVQEFLERDPICWCAEANGEICGIAIAWKEKEVMHFQRFKEELREVQNKLADKKFYMNNMNNHNNCDC